MPAVHLSFLRRVFEEFPVLVWVYFQACRKFAKNDSTKNSSKSFTETCLSATYSLYLLVLSFNILDAKTMIKHRILLKPFKEYK